MCGCHDSHKNLPCSETVLITKHVRFHLWVRDPLSVGGNANELQPGTHGKQFPSSIAVHMAEQPVAVKAALGLSCTSQ